MCFAMLLLAVLADTDRTQPNVLKLSQSGMAHSIPDWREIGVSRIELSNGGLLQSGSCELGTPRNPVTHVRVMDPSSNWTIKGAIHVAAYRDASVEALDGGTIETTRCAVGESKNVVGRVVIKGRSSSWKVNDHLTVGDQGVGHFEVTDAAQASIGNWTTLGNAGDGTLSVSKGASLHSGNWVDLGSYAGSTGAASVSGKGSAWQISAALSVGESGDGKLSISQGGTVANGNWASIGRYEGGVGHVMVQGKGASWTIGSYASIGGNGDGQLTVVDGGFVHGKSRITLGKGKGNGLINIENYGRMLVDGYLAVGPGSGRGTLRLDSGHLAADRIEIGSHGTVQGAGVITARQIRNRGRLLVTSANNLRIVGEFTQDEHGTTAVTLGRNDGRAIITTVGTADLAGTLHLSHDAAFPISGESTYRLVSADRMRGQFANVTHDAAFKGFKFDVSYSGESVEVRVTRRKADE